MKKHFFTLDDQMISNVTATTEVAEGAVAEQEETTVEGSDREDIESYGDDSKAAPLWVHRRGVSWRQQPNFSFPKQCLHEEKL